MQRELAKLRAENNALIERVNALVVERDAARTERDAERKQHNRDLAARAANCRGLVSTRDRDLQNAEIDLANARALLAATESARMRIASDSAAQAQVIQDLQAELKRVDEALDDEERAGGDAPHRAMTRALRIQVLAMQKHRDEEVLVRDACGLERVMHVARGWGRLRIPVQTPLAVGAWNGYVPPTPLKIRDFDYRGRRDTQGRRILEEVL